MQKCTTILGIIELRLKGEGYRIISKRYGIGSSTITLIMKRFKDSGLSIEDLVKMEPHKVEELFFPPDNKRRREIPMPDFSRIHKRMLEMGRRADLSLLWIEYKEQEPSGYQLSQFYKLYNEYVSKEFGITKASMPVERIPGEKMYIDWAGDQPEILVDEDTGVLGKVHIFVTTLGFSSKAYAEAFLDEKLPSFIAGTVHALNFYGAVPKYLVPDNLKSAVNKHSKDGLVLSTSYSDLEDFYDVVVLPPPPRKPRGKATVENHVKTIEDRIIAYLDKQKFTSLSEINSAIQQLVDDINAAPFQKKSDIRNTRDQAFQLYDKPRMKELPAGKYMLCDYKYILHVPDNYHVEYDGHYYSVPHGYRKQAVLIKATMYEIRICDANNKLICKHERTYKTFPLYITEPSHMRPEHLFYKETNAHDGDYYRRWASVFGDAMATLIDRVLRFPKHEEQAYNSCAGMLHMCKDLPHSIVAEAAQKCLDAKACKYTYFKKALTLCSKGHNPNGAVSTGRLPSHKNIRGREFYS